MLVPFLDTMEIYRCKQSGGFHVQINKIQRRNEGDG